MDGIHDLGGRQGFGPVRYTVNATAFHAPWEVRANSLYALSVRHGIFNMDVATFAKLYESFSVAGNA